MGLVCRIRAERDPADPHGVPPRRILAICGFVPQGFRKRPRRISLPSSRRYTPPMSDERIDEILARLKDLEQHVYAALATPVPNEKLMVDTIVRLVAEQVERILERRLNELTPPQEGRSAGAPRDREQHEGDRRGPDDRSQREAMGPDGPRPEGRGQRDDFRRGPQDDYRGRQGGPREGNRPSGSGHDRRP